MNKDPIVLALFKRLLDEFVGLCDQGQYVLLTIVPYLIKDQVLDSCMLWGGCLGDSQDMSDAILLEYFSVGSGLNIRLVDSFVNLVDILSYGAVPLGSLILAKLLIKLLEFLLAYRFLLTFAFHL